MKWVALLILVVTAVVFVSLVLQVTRTVRRAVERTRRQVNQVRDTVAEARLVARAAQPGPVGEVARVRRALRASLTASHETLRAGAERDEALREALALVDQLRGHAQQLDGELAELMTNEPNRARVAARLPELRERADRIRRSADSLRFAAQDRARHDGRSEALDGLLQQIAIEADALRHWTPAPGAERRPGLDGAREPRAER